jgi:hypothetical protein
VRRSPSCSAEVVVTTHAAAALDDEEACPEEVAGLLQLVHRVRLTVDPRNARSPS